MVPFTRLPALSLGGGLKCSCSIFTSWGRLGPCLCLIWAQFRVEPDPKNSLNLHPVPWQNSSEHRKLLEKKACSIGVLSNPDSTGGKNSLEMTLLVQNNTHLFFLQYWIKIPGKNHVKTFEHLKPCFWNFRVLPWFFHEMYDMGVTHLFLSHHALAKFGPLSPIKAWGPIKVSRPEIRTRILFLPIQ